TGHPVDVVTGRVVTDQVDFALPGPIPLKFERTYYSASRYNGPLGHGWHHAYDQRISLRADSIVLRTGDGRDIEFDRVEEGQTQYEPVERLFLERRHNEFIVRTPEQRVLHFGPARPGDDTYPLRRIDDLNNNSIHLEYDGRLLTAIVDG